MFGKEWDIIEVTYSQFFEIPGIKDIQVETLKSYHNSDSLGYVFVTKRKKLKTKYLNVKKGGYYCCSERR